MFVHNFKYSLKVLFQNKMLLFWTFAFPILLGTFFHMAFSDIEKNETLDTISIAVVDHPLLKENNIWKQTLNSLSDKKNKKQLFDITYTNLINAKKLLKDHKITGYLWFDKQDVHITVHSDGVEETILRYTIDEITSNQIIINDLSTKTMQENSSIDVQKISQEINHLLENNQVNLNNISSSNLSYTMIEYYTLIAMACLYGGILSLFITNQKLANMNSVGKRTSVSGSSKGILLLSSLLASYVVQLLGILILFLFTIFILQVDYGNHLMSVLLLAILGSFAGLSFGVTIATRIKASENTKTGILIAITMLWCFLSGMMGITMKYIVDKNIPILNQINPASMITDGFYSLYYYQTSDRFLIDVISLIVFSCIMIFLSYHELRRQKYDSI